MSSFSTAAPSLSGQFIISLDFELMWGFIHGKKPFENQGRLLGTRQAIPRILALFEYYKIRATWATVGLLACRSRSEMLLHLEHCRFDPTDSHYRYLQHYIRRHVGVDENNDPIHFAGTLLQHIRSAPGQEVATHSFSHYCTSVPGTSCEQLIVDLEMGMLTLQKQGFDPVSLVFPKNQVRKQVLKSCRSLGIRTYRGNLDVWIYRWHDNRATQALARICRLLDSYLPVVVHDIIPPDDELGLAQSAASRFLRPWTPGNHLFHPWHIQRIKREMSHAAANGLDYHLWWHPHNFGLHTDMQLQYLEEILQHQAKLELNYAWGSSNMRDRLNRITGA